MSLSTGESDHASPVNLRTYEPGLEARIAERPDGLLLKLPHLSDFRVCPVEGSDAANDEGWPLPWFFRRSAGGPLNLYRILGGADNPWPDPMGTISRTFAVPECLLDFFRIEDKLPKYDIRFFRDPAPPHNTAFLIQLTFATCYIRRLAVFTPVHVYVSTPSIAFQRIPGNPYIGYFPRLAGAQTTPEWSELETKTESTEDSDDEDCDESTDPFVISCSVCTLVQANVCLPGNALEHARVRRAVHYLRLAIDNIALDLADLSGGWNMSKEVCESMLNDISDMCNYFDMAEEAPITSNLCIMRYVAFAQGLECFLAALIQRSPRNYGSSWGRNSCVVAQHVVVC